MFRKYNFHENGIKMDVYAVRTHTHTLYTKYMYLFYTFVYSGAHTHILSHKMRRSVYNFYYSMHTHNMSVGKWSSPDPRRLNPIRKCTSLFLIRTFILFQHIHFNRESIWHFQWILWKEPPSLIKHFFYFTLFFFGVWNLFSSNIEMKCAENKWRSRNEFQRIQIAKSPNFKQ